jgi:hypothetical protein
MAISHGLMGDFDRVHAATYSSTCAVVMPWHSFCLSISEQLSFLL